MAPALAACDMVGGGPADSVPVLAASELGPQADYPVVVGDPYTIGGVTYTPADVLNYDHVGYLSAEQAGGTGITGSHRILPLPSYVEVTSLATGRTIVVRLERRGPMSGTELIALSQGALAQLDASPGVPVRVRRVSPPEDQRALLRAGQQAALRMDTPMSLVEILKRKLPGETAAAVLAQVQPAPAAVPPSASPPPRAASAVPALPPLPARGAATTAAAPRTFEQAFPARSAAPAPVRSNAGTGFLVQAASFSTSDRARSAARVLEGDVTEAGGYYRVRTGPFATRGEAEASLAKVRAAGYRDARIQTSG